MYNIDIKIHNNYKIKIIDSITNTVKYSKTFYNSASSINYLKVVTSSGQQSLKLLAVLENPDYDENNSNSKPNYILDLGGVTFTKTDDSYIPYDGTAKYTGSIVINEKENNKVGKYEGFKLGPVPNSDDCLSEVSVSFEKKIQDRISIDIDLYISVSTPGGNLVKFFDNEHSILTSNSSFPFAIPSFTGISSIPWDYINNDFINGKILSCGNFNQYGNFNDSSYVFSNGSLDDDNDKGQNFSYSNFNIGTFSTILLNGIGVMKVNPTRSGDVIINDYQILNLSDYYNDGEWLTYSDSTYAYIYYKVIPGCTISQIKIQGNTSSGEIEYQEPGSVVTFSGISDEADGDILSINLKSRTLWKTLDGKTLSENDSFNIGSEQYLWFGKNINCITENEVLKPYMIYTNKGNVYVTKSPKINDLGYCFSSMDENHINQRLFDADILRITSSIDNMGGFKIPKNITNGIVTCTLTIPSNMFFKTNYNTSTFKYKITINNG